MNIIFEYADKKLILPVNPEMVKVTKPSQSQKVEVIGIGEVSVPQTRKLATISISSFFWYDLFSQNFLLSGLGAASSFLPSSVTSAVNTAISSGISTAVSSLPSSIGGVIGGIIDDAQKFTILNEYVKWFEDWQASKQPARWTIVVPPNDPPQCFDFNVTCENFSYEIRAGEENDYYYNLELLEWRDYGAVVLNETKKTETQPDGTQKETTTYEEKDKARQDVKPRKTEISCTDKSSIWSVSKQYCKDNWKDLYNDSVNKALLANSPNSLNGMVLKVPKQYIQGVV